jgi:hypothetical protein
VGNIGLIHIFSPYGWHSGVNAINILVFVKGNVGIGVAATSVETCYSMLHYLQKTRHRKKTVDKLCVILNVNFDLFHVYLRFLHFARNFSTSIDFSNFKLTLFMH